MVHHIFFHTILNPAPHLSSTLPSFYLSVPSLAPQIQPHLRFFLAVARWLYSTLPRCCASPLTHYSSLQHIPMSQPAPAGFPHPPPLVASEGGADGDVLEHGVSADEVHSKWQIIRSHPFQFCCTETNSTFQLPDASFFRRT